MPISWQHQPLHELIFKGSMCAGMVFPKKFFLNLVRNWLVSRSIQVALSPGKTPIIQTLLWKTPNIVMPLYFGGARI